MAQWWQPTGPAYLGRVSQKLILEAVSEGLSPEAADNLSALKKEAFVANAGERLAGTGWLPALLRAPTSAHAVDALAAE
jgi:ParB family transcriptional regulator, chromosome partitioning protein